MPSDALPCIVCGRALGNEHDQAVNQPSGGTAFETHGHYGSTAFDPMDGTYLEVNVCDPCLIAARDRGTVLHGMDRQQVVCQGVGVGWTKARRPLVPWTGDEPEHDHQGPGANRLEVGVEDIGDHDRFPDVEWHHGAVLWAQSEREKLAAHGAHAAKADGGRSA